MGGRERAQIYRANSSAHSTSVSMEVYNEARFGVRHHELEIASFRWIRDNLAGGLLDEFIAVFHVQTEREDMPGEKLLAVRCWYVERRDLILCEPKLFGDCKVFEPCKLEFMHVNGTTDC